MSETHSMQPRTRATIPEAPPDRAPTPTAAGAGKKYDYVRVRVCLDGKRMTTISLDPDLMARAAKVLGSDEKARNFAQAAAMQYVEGQSPARTRSSFASRALMRVINGGAASLP
ncbi:MAG: hypothetical protein ACP5P4_10575 [Steroidobacteraceae bacterium]